MIHRQPLIRLALPALLLVFGLAACAAAATDPLGGAPGSATPAATASPPAASNVPPAASSSASASAAPAGVAGSVSPVKLPGTIVCGPQMQIQVRTICMVPADAPFVAAAEKVLKPDELDAAVSARVIQGAAMCAAIPASDCSGTPPVAVVSFSRMSGPAIVVIVRRNASGQLVGEHA